MKFKLATFFLLLFLPFAMRAQVLWMVNFDNGQYLERFSPDTVANANCIWQIGTPSKAVFTSAHSGSRAMVTDSLNAVPANDTSTFLFYHILDSTAPFHYFTVSFYQQMHGDSSDFGMIEISPDGGQHWINALTEDLAYDIQWGFTGKPALRGSTAAGWEQVTMDLTFWASTWGFYQYPVVSDTLLFRYTYVTDSLTSPMDGWMLDDFEFIDFWEGIGDRLDNGLFDLFPNPGDGPVQIRILEGMGAGKLTVLDLAGRVVLEEDDFSGVTLNSNNWPKGIYMVRFETEERWDVKRFVVR